MFQNRTLDVAQFLLVDDLAGLEFSAVLKGLRMFCTSRKVFFRQSYCDCPIRAVLIV